MDTDKNGVLHSRVAYEILDYLAHNPDSEGSIESIAEWWLLEQRINREMEGIMDAIRELVSNDFVIERRSEDMTVFYSINKNKLSRAIEILKVNKNYEGH